MDDDEEEDDCVPLKTADPLISPLSVSLHLRWLYGSANEGEDCDVGREEEVDRLIFEAC